jgi:2-polyprenyl-3-methyl-5-hydroxy-6-metoxy-1,4-benzoquinol methylase
VRILLDALCPVGLLRKSQGAYSLTPAADAFLVRGKATYCADAYLTFWRDRDRLVEAVQTGTATLDIPGPAAEDLWTGYTASDLLTWPQRAKTARERWTQVGITAETRQGLRVLDVACGSGVGSLVLAQDDPTTHVTALDLPKVLAIAAQVAETMGVREQVTFLPGNLLEVEFPAEQFDVVWFGAILYYFSPDNITAVFRKAHHALKLGSLVVIRSIIADEERCQDETALLLAVELLHDAPDGEVYAFSDYKTFLEASDFTDVTQHGDSLITAKKGVKV